MSLQSHRLSRRGFVGSLAGLAAGGAILEQASGQQGSAAAVPDFTGPLSKEKLPKRIEVSKPNGLNLIVIICDTFRWDYLHANAGGRVENSASRRFRGTVGELPELLRRRPAHHSRPAGHAHRPGHPSRPGEMGPPAPQRRHSGPKSSARPASPPDLSPIHPHYFEPDLNFHRGFTSWEWIRGQETDPYVSGPRGSVHPEEHVPRHMLNDAYREMLIQYLLNTKDRQGRGGLFLRRSCAAAARWLRDNKDNGRPLMLLVGHVRPARALGRPPAVPEDVSREISLGALHLQFGIRRRADGRSATTTFPSSATCTPPRSPSAIIASAACWRQ